MTRSTFDQTAPYVKRRRRSSAWRKFVRFMACVVVFCTTYALILPALTLENNACPRTEHIHSDDCYEIIAPTQKTKLACSRETLGIHIHTQDCLGSDGTLLCGEADFLVHTHDSTCLDAYGTLVCPLPEIAVHQHTDSCYTQPEVHEHTAECYTLEQRELTCVEHVHTEDCYVQIQHLTCGREESEGHHHNETCMVEKSVVQCGQEESAGHQHSESCMGENGEIQCSIAESQGHFHTESCMGTILEPQCGIAESEGHHHDDSCYETTQELVCEIESDHQHTDACYAWEQVLTCEISTQLEASTEPVLTCGEPEVILHEHTADCSDDNGYLICGMTQVLEHRHTDTCFETVEEPVDTESLTCTLPEDENHTHTALCYGTWELTCGMEEHTHTSACFSDAAADVETAQEWEQTFADVRLTGEWPVDVIAIAKTQLGYTESTKNYTVWEDGSQHGYTRYGEWYGSPYGDWCAMFASFCIHYADVEGMPLNWGCRTWIADLEPLELYCPADSEDPPRVGDLVFYDWEQDGLSDHVGLVAELVPASAETAAKLIAIEGNSSNQVRYVTYDLDAPVILGYGRLPEQTFYCGKAGHAHTSECGSACSLEEHIHTDSCEVPVVEEMPTELSYEGPDYKVTVQYGADAALPEGVTLEVSEIPGDSEEYQDFLSQAAAAMENAGQSETVLFARFFDIRFLLDGETLEPAAPVSVTITYAEPVETAEDANCQAIHFAEAGTEILDVTTEQKEDGSTSFTHTQNGFSVVGDVVTVSAAKNPADVGPNRLPVDYYVCIDGTWTCVGSTKTGWYFVGDGSLTNYNRDYITVEQAVSILEPYGFTGTEDNPSRVTAYQQKSGHTNIYSDTDTVTFPEGASDGKKILPLSRNADHAGYNLYYLPNNTAQINGVSSPEGLDKTANGFYTVKVFDAQGVPMISSVVLTDKRFEYDASETGVTAWLVVYGDGMIGRITGSRIIIENITSTVTVSPDYGGDAGSRSVTFKVMIDGQWKTVGSLPYYYSGTVNGSQRAYITSAMAAQMFGNFGYTATADPGYHFGYSYDDIYKIFYAGNTGYCMDVSGNKIADGTPVQLWTSNSSTAQIFRIWDSGEGYSYITPVENSTYHVNVLGGGTADGTKLGIHTATDAASHWKVVSNGDGTTSFYNKNAPDTAVIDLPNGDVIKGNQLQIMSNGANRYWQLVQQYRISNNTASSQNTDGTWNIGLTTESNGDIVCYYLPGETAHAYTDKAESEIDGKNSCWSVSVRDVTHAVYSDGELSGMVQIVKPGAEATVTVRNAEGILWSCQGMNGEPVEVESSQSDGDTTFVIKNITQPVEVVATKADPSFTVQYYANIPRFADSGDKSLTVIDTSGRALPTNGGSMATRSLYLEGIGQNTNQNNGDATPLYRIKTTTELTKMYTEKQCQYESEPGLEYFNKLKDNEDYVLKEIWVLREGKAADSTNPEDWDVYTYDAETTFTNEAGQAGEKTILITDNAVVRLVFDASSGDYHNGTTFYDYNISGGKNTDGSWITTQAGINSAQNYTGTGAKFAFGNQNCGVVLKDEAFGGNTLNKANSTNPNYGKSTFGIVTGLDENGDLVYNSAVTAPKLFNDGDAIGKQTYTGSSLTFDRVGNTYTLSSATLANSNGQSSTINELQYFFNPSPTPGRIWDGVNSGLSWQSKIFTNNFWPLDSAAGRTDGMWGKYGSKDYFNKVATNYDFPTGDDGNAHNCFFGMNFALSFNLTADYEGPLEYYFFGDDDLWVFLDNQLVCDIGGVHISIGEFVNLRDYLPTGSSGQHTLSFFYTERGASGSTCYMSFTLPSVSSATTSRDTGSLQIAKSVEGTEGADFSGEEYKFKVELLTSENGSGMNRTFSYQRSDGTYGTVKNGGTITLHQNETATINGIPAGTFYRVTELTTEGYHITVNGNEGYIASGKIETGAIKPASFVNRPYTELPNTGGSGTGVFSACGLVLTLLPLAWFTLRLKRKD